MRLNGLMEHLTPSFFQDGSLQNGDHLLAIGDVRLWGMGAEQVASILRQAGQDSIRLVVARPMDPAMPNYMVSEQGQSAFVKLRASSLLSCVFRG